MQGFCCFLVSNILAFFKHEKRPRPYASGVLDFLIIYFYTSSVSVSSSTIASLIVSDALTATLN